MKEMIQKKISQAIMITCTSFTIIMVIYAFIGLFIDEKWQMSNKELLIIFIVCAAVASAISITLMLPIDNTIVKSFISFTAMFVVVFFFGGGLLKMFPFEPKVMLLVFGMICAAFIGVSIHVIRAERLAAVNINAKLSEIKKKNRRG